MHDAAPFLLEVIEFRHLTFRALSFVPDYYVMGCDLVFFSNKNFQAPLHPFFLPNKTDKSSTDISCLDSVS